MKVISIFNQKGGVAKTTTAVNLSTCLAQAGYNVLIVDIDGQSNATKNFDRYNPNMLSIYDLLVEKNIDTVDVIQDTEIDNLDILPSSINLIRAENIISNDTFRSRETRLKTALKSIQDEYDYVIIDCPPSLGILVSNALVSSDFVITPLKIDKYGLDGFASLTEAIESVQEDLNPNLEFLGILVTMDKSTNINKDIKELLEESMGDKLFKTTIKENVEVVKATFENKPVVIFNPKARASQDYIEFSKEVLEYVKK